MSIKLVCDIPYSKKIFPPPCLTSFPPSPDRPAEADQAEADSAQRAAGPVREAVRGGPRRRPPAARRLQRRVRPPPRPPHRRPPRLGRPQRAQKRPAALRSAGLTDARVVSGRALRPALQFAADAHVCRLHALRGQAAAPLGADVAVGAQIAQADLEQQRPLEPDHHQELPGGEHRGRRPPGGDGVARRPHPPLAQGLVVVGVHRLRLLSVLVSTMASGPVRRRKAARRAAALLRSSRAEAKAPGWCGLHAGGWVP